MSDGKEAKKEEADDLAMKDITDPRESDVLCGRGGAALRHPGNQTYRRLVNLNKGLYITCLKTEKLKISRSIVAAIREQEGRFLERDAKKQTWYDIGDKKAIEKTSQALREGQPKLRQKMIDSGQIPPNHGNVMEHQFGNGIYNPGGRPPSLGTGSTASSGLTSGLYSSDGSHYSMGAPSMNPPTTMSSAAMDKVMPPPPARSLSNDVTADMMMQRLSLTSIGPRSIPSWTPSVTSSMDGGDNQSIRSRLRPSLQPRGSGVAENLGLGPDAAMSVLSDFSAYNGVSENQQQAFGTLDMYSQQQQQQQQFQQEMGADSQYNNGPAPPPPPPAMSPMMESPSIRTGYDRRRLFAKMKFSRQPSQRSDGDGMPDIHMVDSTFSLMSNLSNHGSRHETMLSGLSNHGSRHDTMLSGLSNHGSRHEGMAGLSNLSSHSEMMTDTLGLGSRRSLMSGLSRISDHSGNSIFSDLSKKIGSTNISMRSIAMSEVSGIDEGSETDEFNFDAVTKTSSS